MARFLVTGGAGFIGSHLARELLREHHEVVVLDDLSGGSRERVPAGARFVHGSVTDEPLVTSLLAARRFAGVFHLAAFAAEAISHAVRRHNYATNVLGSVNLINASVRSGVGFFGFASSVAVYGDGRTPMREADDPVPVDSYGLAKLTVERELALTMRMHGMPFTAFRMHNVYGEWQSMHDPYRNAVAIFLNQVLRGEPITIYGGGQQVRAFTYVGDIVGVLVRAAECEAAWGRAFNIGSASTYTILDLVARVKQAMAVPRHPVVHLPARAEVMAAYTDTSLGREVLGEWPETPLEEGLARTAAWAREQGSTPLRSSFDLELGGSHLPDWARAVEGRLARSDRP